jgi:capsular polysaccharide biosynthesis protein
MASTYRLEDSSDQIDLAKYAAPIVRRWRLVLGIAVLVPIVAAVAVTVLSLVAPRYQSQVTILLTGPRYKIAFDPKFTTVDSATAPAATRANEYRIIATSPEVRQATFKALEEQIAPENLGAVTLNANVSGQLLTAIAGADDPDRATVVANAYATAVAARLDAVYGQSDQDRQAIAKKLDETIAAHQDAQNQLNAFTRESRIDALALQIAQKESARQSLAEERASSIRNRLAGYYGALVDADQIVRSASSLRDQVQAAANASAPATGASLSLATLQSRLVNLGALADEAHVDLSRDNPARAQGSDRTPAAVAGARAASLPQIQLQLSGDSLARSDADPKALLASIDTLIASTRAQQEGMRRSIDDLSQQVASGTTTQDGSTLDATIAQLTSELTTLQADYRQQTFRRDVLAQNVEQAKSTRATLEAKLSEADVAAQAAGGGAVVVSGANANQSWPPGLSRILPVAIAAGLVLGVVAALALEWKSRRRSVVEQTAEAPPPVPRALVH